LYFAATSGVCLIRSGAAGFQKKLQSQKRKLDTRGMRSSKSAGFSNTGESAMRSLGSR
jgi:hypothetical protein